MKRILSALSALVLAISPITPSAPEHLEHGGVLTCLYDERVSVKSETAWQDFTDVLFLFDDVDPNKVWFGYYNFATGEEQYYRGDEYVTAASMYKVPLNMIFAEKIYNGEMTEDTKLSHVPYSSYRDRSLIDSSNDASAFLWSCLGGYREFKDLSAPYMTDDVEGLTWKYYENNFFTCRQFIHCLKLLYEQQERFPGIIETMQVKDDPYFGPGTAYPMAAKTGYLPEEFHTYQNDCAIVFAKDAFAIVMFTDNLPNAYQVLSDYCSIMCDYTDRVSRMLEEPVEVVQGEE